MGTKIVALLLTPPGVILLLALIGFLVQIRWRATGNIIIGLSLFAFVVLAAESGGVFCPDFCLIWGQKPHLIIFLLTKPFFSFNYEYVFASRQV